MVEPCNINGKWYTELLSYGETQGVGEALQNAQRHFNGRNDLVVLEVGVLRGHNAVNINEWLHPESLILVDPWDFCAETHANNWSDLWYRIQAKDNITVIKATSEKVALLINPEIQFDYIYLDGDHIGGDLSPGTEEMGIRLDIKLWWPRVKVGGILAGHDANYENIYAETKKVFGDKLFMSPGPLRGGMEWWVYKGEIK